MMRCAAASPSRAYAPVPDYRGVNHARMTEAMETRLRDMPLAFLVLARLRRLVGDGNTITLYGGVRGWAIWMDCSPGYPKAILNRLAHEGLVTVVYLDDGFAEVTVLPPPELADRRPVDDQAVIRSADPTPRPRGRAVPSQSIVPVRSPSDHMSHESESDQLASTPRSCEEPPIRTEPNTHPPSGPAPPPAPEGAPPVPGQPSEGRHASSKECERETNPIGSQLSAIGYEPAPQTLLDGLLAQQIYPALARQIVQHHPQLTLADFERQVARLTARGVYAAPVFVAAKILARGETVAAPEPACPAGPPRKRQPSDTIRFAGHITEAVRAEWLGYCAQYPADTAQIVQEFLARYPVPAQVEVA